VKQFEIIEHFYVSVQNFFEYLIKLPVFEEHVHRVRGNTKINVTEWMCLGNDYWQRLCFYTMEDPDKKGLGNFVCMETQKYYYNGDIFRLDSTISPDNSSVGNVFNIKSEWTLSKVSENQCDLKIFVEVECKRNIIGFQGMVEGALASKVRTAYETWCRIALEKVKEEQEKSLLDNEHNIISSTKDFYQTNRVRLHHRIKSIHHKVVSGTENIVRLFQDQNSAGGIHSEGSDIKYCLLDKEKESGEEGLISITDIDEVMPPRKDAPQLQTTSYIILFILLLLFFVIVILFLVFY